MDAIVVAPRIMKTPVMQVRFQSHNGAPAPNLGI